MLDASGFFCFRHEVPAKGSDAPRLYAFAYKPPGRLKPGVLDQLILELCRGPGIPDSIVVLGLSGDESNELRKELKAPITRLSRGRIEGRIALISALYDVQEGKLDLELLDPAFAAKLPQIRADLQTPQRAWMKSGLEAIFRPADVVLRAPSGYAYQKPSGSRAEIFLKPDLGLKSSASVGYVALCLYDRVYAGRTEAFTSLRTVYVDTMAVSSVAYALRDLLAHAKFSGAYHIESFHSYGGMADVPQPLPGTSLCIISASTSMGMQEQWIAEKGVGSFEVVTLLTLTSAKLQARALLALSPPVPLSSPGPVQLSIRIKGETFLPEQELAKKVLLRDQVHRCDDEVKHFRDFAGQGVFDTYRQPIGSGATPRALFVDGEMLLRQEAFGDWLQQTLAQTVKAATTTIVFQEDASSRQLAIRVKKACESKLGLKSLNMVPALSLRAAEISNDGGVIICASVVGKGSQLLEVSRTLRDKHIGPRLYLVGFQVTETRSELEALRMNLVHSKGIRHDFQRFGAVAIGTQLRQSFEQEKTRYYAFSSNLQRLPKNISRRAKLLGSASPVGSLALLPHGARVDEQLKIRPGFAYWPDGFSAGAFHAEILGTIAVLLQRAREDSKLSGDNRLSSATYQHVVLDPENFARFNDGILQAALMRCAYPSELDFRADYAASDFMKSLILRALARATDQGGEAILEFLLALEQDRLQLVDVHRENVMASARACTKWAPLKRALSFLINPKLPDKMPF
jgi:hypothetical protein